MILVYLGGLLTGVGLAAVTIVTAGLVGDESDEVSAWGLRRDGEPFGYDHSTGSLPRGYKPVSSERAGLIRGTR